MTSRQAQRSPADRPLAEPPARNSGGKRVGFKPPPPPAQTPSSVSVCPALLIAATIALHPLDSRLCSPRSDQLRPQPAHAAASGSGTGLPRRSTQHATMVVSSLSRSCRPGQTTAGARLPDKYRSRAIPLP
ncbi:unnamed protein product [Coccothraustes coccothraustes]